MGTKALFRGTTLFSLTAHFNPDNGKVPGQPTANGSAANSQVNSSAFHQTCLQSRHRLPGWFPADY